MGFDVRFGSNDMQRRVLSHNLVREKRYIMGLRSKELVYQ